MNYIKRFIDFLLFGNIYIALGAFLLSQSTIFELKLKLPISYSILVFFSTLFIYNIQRLFYKTGIYSTPISIRRKWISKHQKIIIGLTIIGLIGTCISLFYCDTRVITILSPLGLLSVGYFFPAIQLRKFALLKIFILVSVWTVTCYLAPILLSNNAFSIKNLAYIISGFSFMTAICLPFDNRDIEIDKKENIQTFSVLYGTQRVNQVAFIFSLLYFTLLFISEVDSIVLTINLIVFSVCSVFILKNNNPRNEYYYIAGIDGILILKGILCYSLI